MREKLSSMMAVGANGEKACPERPQDIESAPKDGQATNSTARVRCGDGESVILHSDAGKRNLASPVLIEPSLALPAHDSPASLPKD
jgi:hypothetical protein